MNEKKQIEKLQKELAELKDENFRLEFQSKLNRFIADQRLEYINELLRNNLQDLNQMNKLIPRDIEFINKLVERLKQDNEKFDILKEFIQKTFPSAVMQKPPEQKEKKEDDKLSNTYIGENGAVYKEFHLVDLAILIMTTQQQRLKEILGTGFDLSNNSDEDI